MICQELDLLLYPYLDGEFQPEERSDVETHLADCMACARRVEQEREIRQALRRAARHSLQSSRAPASLHAGIQLGLRREQRRAHQLQFLRVGAAALVVVAVGGGWVTLRPEKSQRFVEDATYISHEARPEGEGKSGRRIGIFLISDAHGELDAQSLPSMPVSSSDGNTVVLSRDGEIVYELVSDLDEADILKLLLEKERASRRANAPRPVEPPLSVQPVSHSP